MSDYSAKSDKELLEELLENEPLEGGMIAELISRHMKTVFSIARRYSDSADYEELVSDGMQGLLSAIRGYNSEKGEFSAFVSVCVNNRLKNTAKRALRRTSRLSESDPEQLEAIPDPKPTPEEAVIAKENSESLFNHIKEELTELELHCIEGAAMGLAYGEIASKLGVSKKTVDNALTRARAKLRRLYTG